MCGILGVWRAPHMTTDGWDLALRRLAHRGPDDSGTYADQGLLLGHRRLSIIDLSPTGHQPMASADGQTVIVFNGELYNFQELRRELEQSGHAFRGHSDTEVLLAMYCRDGLAMLPRLNGIFAFAIYDRRAGELTLVRDALGVKPLYYSEGKHGVAFASETKALLALLPEPCTVDYASLHRYLTFLWCPGEGTPLKEVRKLEPGHALIIRQGHIARRWQWYRLPVERSPNSEPQLSTAASVEAVASGLRAAVARQMVADVPVGAFLSGGLDSSAIVAFARERTPNLRCFTIEAEGGQDSGDADDLPYARQVASHLGVSLDVVRIDSSTMANDLERMVYMLDEPLADPAPLNVLYISRAARAHGIKVLLSGAGGDDLFTGYRRHLAIQLDDTFGCMPLAVRSALARGARGLDQHNAFSRRLARFFANANRSGDARMLGYFAWSNASDLSGLLSRDFLEGLADAQAEEPMANFLRELPKGHSQLSRLLGLEQKFFLADHNLIYTDKMSMAVSLEVRVPFLDLELVELAARVRDWDKRRFVVNKWVLKKAMEPYLPRNVIYRPKTGFGAPLRRWMRHELRELLGDVLSPQSLQRRGLFEPAAVTQLIAQNDAGRKDAAYTLLSLLCMELWFRHFCDQPGKQHDFFYSTDPLSRGA